MTIYSQVLSHAGASQVAQLVKNPLQCRRPWFNCWVGKISWRRDRLPTPVFLGFLGGSDGKESAFSAEDLGSILWLGRSSGGGHGNLPQHSCLDNPHGQRSLVGYSPWGWIESEITEWLRTAPFISFYFSILQKEHHFSFLTGMCE